MVFSCLHAKYGRDAQHAGVHLVSAEGFCCKLNWDRLCRSTLRVHFIAALMIACSIDSGFVHTRIHMFPAVNSSCL